jgi:hypothetical protein
MKVFYLLPLTMMVLLNSKILSQEPDTLWTKRIGGDSIDVAYDVEELWDGGFAVLGYTNSFALTNYDIWLLRTNSNGDTLWTKTYGGDGDEYGYSLKKTDDGGFILAGKTNSFVAGGFDFYVIRINSIGDTLWTRTFGGINNDICWSIDTTEDGGFVLAGEKNAFPLSSDVWVIKTDSMGLIVWEKIFGTSNPDYVFSISSANNGNLSLAGYFYVGFNSGGFNAWLFEINAFGDSLWSHFYGGDYTERFYSHTITSDQGYICVGYLLPSLGDYPDLYLVKTDSLGNEQWSQTLDYDNDGDIGYSVQQTTDGGYIITGEARPFDGVPEAWIVRTDSIGNILWDKLFPFFPDVSFNNPTDGTHGGNSVKQTSGGGYIIAGYSDKFQGNHLDVYLVRIASDIVPVELTFFTATVERNAVSLNWQTATETNNSGFEIERKQVGSAQSSVGNLDWSAVGFVPGFGTTTEPKSYSFIDENLSAGTYQYRLKQIDFDGSFEYSNTIEVEINSPTEFSLGQNYPNPFNPTTKIKYTIPSVTLRWQSHRQAQGDILVSLKVFDVLGNEVATLVNQSQQPSTYEVEFNADKLSSGVYYYQLRAGSFVESKKMILLR